MNALRQQVNSLFSDALQSAGYDGQYGTVEIHPMFDDRDYRYDGVLQTARLYGASPEMLAAQIFDTFGGQSAFSELRLEDAGFINIRLADPYLTDHIRKMMMDERLCNELIPNMRLTFVNNGKSDHSQRWQSSFYFVRSLNRLFQYEYDEAIPDDETLNPVQIYRDTEYSLQNNLADFIHALSFPDQTNPYLLYIVAHIRALLHSTSIQSFNTSHFAQPQNHAERRLLLHLAEFPESVLLTYQKRTPDILTIYAYKLAFQYTQFYAESRILTNRNKAQQESWLQLAKFCLYILEHLLSLLDMEIPKQIS